MAKRQSPPDLFNVADELNAQYQGTRVRITAAGRRAEGVFLRCERIRYNDGKLYDCILIDYDFLWDLRWPDSPRTRASHNPVSPWCVFYAKDAPEIEVLTDEAVSEDA